MAEIKRKLISAVQDGNLEEVERLASELNDTFLSGWSRSFDLLCLALKNKRLEIAKQLVSHGCLLKIGSQKSTALHVAVLHGDVEIVKMIRDRKQRVNRYVSRICSTRDVDEEGRAALHVLAQRCPVDEECSQVLDHLLLSLSKIDIKHNLSGFTPLHFAAECGNVEMIPLLLNKGAEVDSKAKEDRTPLHIAIKNEHLEIVCELLKYKADPNAAQSNGYTSLHMAAEKGHLKILQILLEHGAEPNSVDEIGRTPLHTGIRSRSLPIVTALLNTSCEMSSFFTLEKPGGYSPLHVAVEVGSEDIVKFFLDKGISVDSTTQRGYTSLHLAARKGNTAMVKLLMQYNANPKAKGPTRMEIPLLFAVESGNLETVEILYEAITSTDEEWLEGYASLFIAAYHGHELIVRTMLDKGVKPNANFGRYLMPLQAAAQKGHETICNILLEHGAEVNPKEDDKKFSTPLIAACLSGHKEIVKILLERGADMNVKVTSKPEEINSELECFLTYGYCSYSKIKSAGYNLGYMPIHFAVASGEKAIVEMLVERGADVNATGEDVGTPLYLAVKHQHEEIVAYLLENGAKVDAEESGQSLIFTAISTNNFGIVQKLLDFNASVNFTSTFKEEKGYTPLHLAVVKSTPSIVELLLKKGSIVDANTEQDIPLHRAIERNEENIIRKLIEYGACIDSQCSKGLTPLFHALENGNMKVFKLLLKKGASFDIKTAEGVSLLHFAIQSRLKEDVIKFIINYGADVNEEFNSSSINWFTEYDAIDKNFKDTKLLKLFLKFDLDVNSKRDSLGKTILHHACHTRRPDVVELLLRQDINLNILDSEGHTPFWYAVKEATSAWDAFHEKVLSGSNKKDERPINRSLNFADSAGYKLNYEREGKIAREIMNNNDKHVKIAQLITQELTKLEAAGEDLHSENIILLKSDFVNDYYTRCQTEIEKLKEKKAAGLVSYFDILIASEIKLVHYARNYEIKKSLRSIKQTFPLYESILKARFERGEERKFVMHMTASFFKRVSKLEIPDLATDQLFSYLRLTDLKNFCRACKPFIFVS